MMIYFLRAKIGVVFHLAGGQINSQCFASRIFKTNALFV